MLTVFSRHSRTLVNSHRFSQRAQDHSRARVNSHRFSQCAQGPCKLQPDKSQHRDGEIGHKSPMSPEELLAFGCCVRERVSFLSG